MSQAKPTVGMLCTVSHPSDSYSARVTWVSKSGHQIQVKYRGHDETQLFTLRPDSHYYKAGQMSPRLILGVAKDYRSPEL